MLREARNDPSRALGDGGKWLERLSRMHVGMDTETQQACRRQAPLLCPARLARGSPRP
jgi:hypothetical protein